MKYKHVYAAHELRMWLLLALGTVAAVDNFCLRHPDTARRIANKFRRKKSKEVEEPTVKVVIVNREGES